MKQRIKLAGTPPRAFVGAPAAVQVIKQKTGTVSTLDELKKYYKSAIACLGAVLVILNEATPILDNAHWFTYTVSVATAILTFLKSNEHWVDGM